MVYDNVAHTATSNSHRLCAILSRQDCVSTINDKLKELRGRAVPKLSVRKLAEALGMPPSTYAAYEDPAKFKKPILPLNLAKQIADVLVPMGIDRSDVLQLAGLTGEFSGALSKPGEGDDEEWLEVAGTVAAGVWRSQTDWPASERYEVRFGRSQIPKEQRFGLRMEGLSMNRTIQPGSDLECLWIKFSPIPPQPGDLVIVERHMHDLVELTCKRLDVEGDQFVLRCESYEPEFAEPIFIGKPDLDDYSDNEVRVVGIVLAAKQDLAPKGLSERRYRRS